MEEINLDCSRYFNYNSNKLAVKITDAYKSYDSDEVIINGLNMNVKQGTIYSLLGPSGCGKTTLLSSIIGSNTLDSGDIQLSIKKKKDIGYMPQILALFNEFSMLETLHYFGSLYNMSYKEITNKGEKLLRIMEMPPAKTLFGSMSGGQQRRFSLCIALLHDPSLLILDEPTVGLDPIISASVWGYLKALTTGGKTIILTTHYIEEARSADMIGLMRKGVLLAEAPPLEVMASCDAESVEKAFLILSQKQSTQHPVMKHRKPKSTQPATTSLEKSSYFCLVRFYAQLLKHWYWFNRNWTIILFIFLLPIISILIYNLTVGKIPQYFTIGIVNNEVSSECTYEPFDICDNRIPLSCKYVRQMEKNRITLKFYNNIKSAREDILRNSIWGYVMFDKNFTDANNIKCNDPISMTTKDINNSKIWSTLDMSNYVLSQLIKNKLYKTYTDLEVAFKNCNSYTTVIIAKSVPITFMEPIHGSNELNVSEFGSVALISILELYMTFLFTSFSIGMERKSGSFERCLTSGLTITEIIASHLLVQIVVIVTQITTMFVLQFVIFKQSLLRSWIWPGIIMFLQGICGSFLGFTSTAAFNDDKVTTLFGVFLVLMLFTLSGILWPLEAMHPIIKNISILMPLSSSVDAIRALLFKGWDLSHPIVIRGLVTILIWITTTFLIAVYCLNVKRGFKSNK